jgi:beta-xylosidase
MSAPIYRDPIQDGAADPTVIHRAGTDEWWMFYTNRRAQLASADHEWIQGSPIGVAASTDAGLTWQYRGTVAGLDDPADTGLNTHWAPEVVRFGDTYHMYLSYISGTDPAMRTPRSIVHFTSPDLTTWTRQAVLPLGSENVIDACVVALPEGGYRLWYKDEEKGSATWSATSPNLFDWTLEGEVLPGAPQANPHEGPNVFRLGGWYWLIVDEWHGQAVYRSDDLKSWQRQGLLLDAPGSDPMDRRFARHADVVPQGDWAAVYYFTHPEWDEAATPRPLTPTGRATAIHSAKIWVENGRLLADRDAMPLPLDPALPT